MAILTLRRGPLGAAGFSICAILSGCAGQVPIPVRPEPIAYADTLPIEEPAYREPLEAPLLVRDAISGQVAKGISVRRLVNENHEALNVTRFDDVVNSAWFEHRNGRGRMTVDDVFRGPTTGMGPDTTGSIVLTQAKLQGISPGFHIEDSRGVRYVVKFDPQGFQYLSSSAGVIANRLMHAAGFHVPEDYIFRFRREHITGVKEGATYQDEDFVEHPLGMELVDEILARVDTLPDGRFLAVASQYVPGPPLGPFHFSGTRKDDPNDWYAHEHRRDLRGLYVVSSWVNHVDMRFANTMDAFVQPGYVRHYLIDFAASLGSGTIRPHNPRESAEYNFDFWQTMGRMFTLGFYRQGWESEPFAVIDPSIGWMQVETFDPAGWKANWPNEAFVNRTARDGYWGSKLVGSFTDDQIRAAVGAGELPSELAADTLADILRYRRDRIVEHWYGLVTPIENVEIVGIGAATGGFTLVFDDYGIRDGAWTADEVSYRWKFEHEALGRRQEGVSDARVGARQSLVIGLSALQDASLGRAESTSGPATLAITAMGPGDRRGRSATVYLHWDAEAARYRVVGLEH
ncbi:MAG: hypothetical protein HKP01_00355 [Gemmatimonadetes bacterium]|nr:hypothetical protein [Gemmatimonadota bacterium]